MQLIITPGNPFTDSSQKPFAELMNKPGDMKMVLHRLQIILRDSFRFDSARTSPDFAKRHMTQAEINRRSQILFEMFRVMRWDYGFGLRKTLDELPKALRARLDGKEYKPPEQNRIWSPEGV